MTVEFDHLFICTAPHAPEAEALIPFGLVEGSPNTHPGQGTANRRFFFRNAMIELLWVTDIDEVCSDPISSTHLWERWSLREAGACPFGLCFRPDAAGSLPPFSHWIYRPPYLPNDLSILMARSAGVIREPLLFYLPFGQRPDRYLGSRQQPIDHDCGLQEITRVTLTLSLAAEPSADFVSVVDANLIQVQWGEEYRIDLGFDGESQGQPVDFRPGLPLIVHW